MKHVKAIAIKTVVIALISWLVFSAFGEVDHLHSIITGILISLAIYMLGDLVVLRKIGNIVATIADMGGAFLVSWLYLSAVLDGEFLVESLIVAVIVGIFEWFFHDWLLSNHIIPDERSMK